MCVLSIKVPIRKKSGNLFNDPRKMQKLNERLIVLEVKLVQIKIELTNLRRLIYH